MPSEQREAIGQAAFDIVQTGFKTQHEAARYAKVFNTAYLANRQCNKKAGLPFRGQSRDY
jgi:hypothetical protein